jgi:hypothetical protein
MAAFTDLVHRLLTEGSVRLREPPSLRPEERESVLALLANAFDDYRLDVAGPLIPFAPTCALRAMELLAWSSWFLLHRSEPDAEVDRCLPVLAAGQTASEHLSADLVLRFLPQVHRRARAVNPQDLLTIRLEETLRRWPLSGVLADLDNPPLVEISFEQHRGLLLLYAERLAERPRPAWVTSGLGQEYVELVFSERGLPVPAAEPRERSMT